MRFRLDSLPLSVIITALMITVICDVLLYTGCQQNLPFLVSSRLGGTAWTWTVMLNPALVSVAMICCVAYMDQTHLCGTDDATAGLICLVFPFPSFLLTLFCASFCLSSCNLLTSAFRGLLYFILDFTFYCLRTYILWPIVANFLFEALSYWDPHFLSPVISLRQCWPLVSLGSPHPVLLVVKEVLHCYSSERSFPSIFSLLRTCPINFLSQINGKP